MNREEMIRRLVSYSVETAVREPDAYWLQEMFEKGFAGYRRFSDSRLKRELELRGLDEAMETDADEEGFDEADIDDAPPALAPYATLAREPE